MKIILRKKKKEKREEKKHLEKIKGILSQDGSERKLMKEKEEGGREQEESGRIGSG